MSSKAPAKHDSREQNSKKGSLKRPGKAPGKAPGKSKANALRAKKRAAARKARKQRLIALLYKYDQALKAGKSKVAEKFAAALRKEKAGKLELIRMRTVLANQQKAEKAVEKLTTLLNTLVAGEKDVKKAAGSPRVKREIAVAEKKHSDAVVALKRAQKAEQTFFAEMMKLTKNGVCPYCSVERLSIDSHVMDMHPPQWGEYLHFLGKC